MGKIGKKFLTIFVSLFIMISTTLTVLANHEVRATKYYGGHGCGWVTADGSRINNAKINSGDHRWVALSPDMFNKGYKLGDKIWVESENIALRGEWIIKDKMGSRVRNGIDFLMTRENSKGFTNPCKVRIRKV